LLLAPRGNVPDTGTTRQRTGYWHHEATYWILAPRGNVLNTGATRQRTGYRHHEATYWILAPRGNVPDTGTTRQRTCPNWSSSAHRTVHLLCLKFSILIFTSFKGTNAPDFSHLWFFFHQKNPPVPRYIL
jgi:hypothetical protein